MSCSSELDTYLLMLLPSWQSLGKWLGPTGLSLEAFFPGGMGAGTQWCQRTLQREHVGFKGHPTSQPWPLGLWRKSHPSPRAYVKGASVPRPEIVTTRMLGAKLPGPDQTRMAKRASPHGSSGPCPMPWEKQHRVKRERAMLIRPTAQCPARRSVP